MALRSVHLVEHVCWSRWMGRACILDGRHRSMHTDGEEKWVDGIGVIDIDAKGRL